MKTLRGRSLGKRFAAGWVALTFALAMLGLGGGGALAANEQPSVCQAPPAASANSVAGATATQPDCGTATASGTEAGGAGSSGTVTAPGGTTPSGTGEVRVCVISTSGVNASSSVVVIAPGQGQAETGAQTPSPAVPPGAAAGPATVSSFDQAGTAGSCENGAFAPTQGGAPMPSARVCSIIRATGPVNPGSVPAGTVIVVGSVQFCAAAVEVVDTAASATAPDNCVILAPGAIQNPPSGGTDTASGGSVVVIGSTQANPVAANGDVHVCTGDTVNIAPVTVASGSTCTIALPDGATSNGVVIIANGALNCMGNASPAAAPAAPAANAADPNNATAGASTAPGTATQTP